MGAAGDCEGVRELAYRLWGWTEESDTYLKELKARADDLVETHWADIGAVAAVLLEQSELSGAAVRRAIRESREAREV